MVKAKNILYSTGCPKCNVLKKKLDEAGVKYDLVNDEDEMIRLGFSATPMFKRDGNYYDFSETVAWLRSV